MDQSSEIQATYGCSAEAGIHLPQLVMVSRSPSKWDGLMPLVRAFAGEPSGMLQTAWSERSQAASKSMARFTQPHSLEKNQKDMNGAA
ncbi:MAG: hypothetical protein Q7T10_15565 [Rhodoferax sp.]|uniref:hypothetical protein n=1 Tax=Rhodoferax sp. TaxID=50421 RepID=UPI0027242394|nr:hypothetical protein [Rhodoferax sp.]MDO8450214.1 hypothetical protein [Rhodoferax sp.]